MTKRILIAAFVLVFIFALIGCSDGADLQVSTESEDVSQGEDKTVQLENTVDIEGKNIQHTKTSMDVWIAYDDIATLYEHSEEIIRGVVENVEYFYIDNFKIGLTKMDVKVLEVFEGSFNKGDKISTYKIGGYIPLKVALPDIRDRFPEMTDEEYHNTVIDYSLEGDPHPVVGDESIMFLSPGPESIPEGIYHITGNYKGQFVLSNGTFKRHVEIIDDNVNRAALLGANKVFSYKELVKEINKCKLAK